jgi:hypothetical protein
MSVIEKQLALQLPIATDRTLFLAKKVGDTKDFTSHMLDESLKEDLLEFLSKIRHHAMYYQARQCFFNSQITLAYAEKNKKFKGRFKYCEGLAVARIPFAVHHAWLLLDDQYIVDLTWSIDANSREDDLRDRVIGTIPDDWEYFGLTFDLEFVKKQLGKSKMGSISLLDDFQNGFPVTSYYESLVDENYIFSRKKK